MKNCEAIQLAVLEGRVEAEDLSHVQECAECKPIMDMVKAMKDLNLKLNQA